MSHQTFKCCICGEETTKPKSYAVAGQGRACRHHQEAQQAREQTLLQEQKVIDDRIKKEQEKEARFKRNMDESAAAFWKTHRNPRQFCWRCDKDSVEAHEFYTRVLIQMQKLEIRGQSSIPFLDPQLSDTLREEFPNKVVSKFYPIEGLEEWKVRQMIHHKHRSLNQITSMIKHVNLCTTCYEELGLNWNYDQLNRSDEDSFERLMTMAIVVDLMKPTLNAIASNEIAQEEIQQSSERSKS